MTKRGKKTARRQSKHKSPDMTPFLKCYLLQMSEDVPDGTPTHFRLDFHTGEQLVFELNETGLEEVRALILGHLPDAADEPIFEGEIDVGEISEIKVVRSRKGVRTRPGTSAVNHRRPQPKLRQLREMEK